MTTDNENPLMHPWDADGGPAYPLKIDEDSPASVTFKGMSLRDYFAGQAFAQGMNILVAHEHNLNQFQLSNLAKTAYMAADAMLSERSKKQEG